MNFIRFLTLSICLTLPPIVSAESVSERLQQLFGPSSNNVNEEEFLHPDEAFVMSATTVDPDTLNVYWQIADGHYLYHDKFSFRIIAGKASIEPSEITIPPGKIKQDPTFGTIEVNTGDVSIDLALVRQATEVSAITLEIGFQGCKEDSICYPPIKKQVPLVLAFLAQPTAAATPALDPGNRNKKIISTQDAITQGLRDGNLLLNILAFFGFGLLLSFTPCIFPMIPILSGIIVGQGKTISTLHAFMLSLSYVIAMALMYALLGMIAGSFHLNLQAAAQNIWVISGFSLVFVALAFSMFGFYELQLPSVIQSRLTKASDSGQGGKLHGAAIMGALSAIIVGPCVAPPLAGALLYISQTGNAVLGGLSLFAMGLGFGVPLLIIGTSAGSVLPRAGSWMDVIKKIFGVIMLGVAIWFMQRVLPGSIILILWALLIIISAIYLGALDRLEKDASWARLWKGVGIALLVYGVVLVIGALSGGHDVFKPLQGLTQSTGAAHQGQKELSFKTIKSIDDLENELLKAKVEGKAVMLDFYADWCVICNEMEKYTFPNPGVYTALQDVILLKADVTNNDKDDQELLMKFELFGPPAILFFGNDSRERITYRLIGFIEADEFIAHIKQALRS